MPHHKKPLVAICFHLGYNNRFYEFTPYIDTVVHVCPTADIYITYREDEDPTPVCLNKYPNARIMKATRGCDIGAFFLQIQMMLASNKEYEYVFKIHTKSNNSVKPNWRGELLDKISGSSSNVRKVLKSFRRHKSIGMIGGEKWILPREIKFQYFFYLCQKYQVNQDGHFVGGTIFWTRFPILKKFFSSVDIELEYSLCETGKPSEPSYTHAWERVLGLLVETQGYQIQGM